MLAFSVPKNVIYGRNSTFLLLYAPSHLILRSTTPGIPGSVRFARIRVRIKYATCKHEYVAVYRMKRHRSAYTGRFISEAKKRKIDVINQ